MWLYALSCVTSACELRLLLVGFLLRDLPSRLNCGMYDTYCSDRRSGLEMAGHLGESSLPPDFLSSWQFNVTVFWSNRCSRFGQLGGGLAWVCLCLFCAGDARASARWAAVCALVPCCCSTSECSSYALRQPRCCRCGCLFGGQLVPLFHAFVVCPRRCTASSRFSGCMLLDARDLSPMRVSE